LAACLISTNPSFLVMISLFFVLMEQGHTGRLVVTFSIVLTLTHELF